MEWAELSRSGIAAKGQCVQYCLLIAIYAKVSDHEHSKVLKSSHFQLLPNKVKISFYHIFWYS